MSYLRSFEQPWLASTLILAGLTGIILVAYQGTGSVPFIFDDIAQIQEVDHTVPWTLDRWLGRRSLPHFTFDLNVWTTGLAVKWFHAVNLGLHITVSWLVFFLVRELLPADRPQRTLWAGLAGLLFAIHPLQTQTVTYIVQRITLMATLWYVAALIAYLRYRQTNRYWWAAVSLVAAVLAMHSKEIALTLPLAIVSIEVTFFKHLWPKRWWKSVLALTPWLLLLGIIPANILGVTASLFSGSEANLFQEVTLENITQGTTQPGALTRGTYLITQLSVIRQYLQLILWPAGQNIDHDFPIITSIAHRMTVQSVVLIAAVFAAAAWLWHRHQRPAAYGIFFFFLALVPESSIFPLNEVLAENRLYLPLVGITLTAAAFGQQYWPALTRWQLGSSVAGHYIGIIGIAMVCIVLAILTHERNQLWRDPVALWQDSVTKSPHKTRPHNNLGYSLAQVGRLDEGIKYYYRAIELDPTYIHAYVNLGAALGRLGKLEESLMYSRQALAIEPRYLAANYNLAVALQGLGQDQAAIDAYQQALIINPKYVPAMVNLGLLYTRQGDYDLAFQQYQAALHYSSRDADIYYHLATVYFKQGDTDRSMQALQQALKIDPNHVPARRTLQKLQAPTREGLQVLH